MGYTGRTRERVTKPGVRRAENIARFLIGAGGIGTIVAVSLIFFFLVWVVVPIFGGADIEEAGRTEYPGRAETSPVIKTGMDEHRLFTWALRKNGDLRVFRLDTGEQIVQRDVFENAEPTCWTFPPVTKTLEGSKQEAVFGFADGSLKAAEFKIQTKWLFEDDPPEEVKDLKIGERAQYQQGMVQVTPLGQYRYEYLEVAFKDVEDDEDDSSEVVLVDFSRQSEQDTYIGVLRKSGALAIYAAEETENAFTGKITISLSKYDLPAELDEARGDPKFLKMLGTGTGVFLVWPDGFTQRYDARYMDFEVKRADWDAGVKDEWTEYEARFPEGRDVVVVEIRPRLAETFDLVRDAEGQITSALFLNGKTTLLVGDTTGDVRAWFPAKPKAKPGTIDGIITVNAHSFEGSGTPVASLSVSQRTRMAAAGFANGDVKVFQVTNREVLAAATNQSGDAVTAIAISPKENGLLALTPNGAYQWNLELGHPESNVSSLFGKVWYEGLESSAHVWQSTGGTDDFEPKMGLMPLVFGTIKATLYSIIIAAPLAFLAAIFTTEFLDPKLRSPIKSTIEMMASLPSVVLGFLAALVLAPFVKTVLPATLAAVFLVPVTLIVGARLWQMLPTRLSIRWSRTPRFVAILLTFPLGLLLAIGVGGLMERIFFSVDGEPDIMAWLNGAGPASGGWQFLLLPMSALIVGFSLVRFAGPWQREISVQWSRKQCALFDMGKVLFWLAASFGLAMLLGELFAGMGLDARGAVGPDGQREGGLVGSYIPRNAMIVGFVMGFAVVPIIYTLAEDALSSVPIALKEGSLGAGATPWQTATRIVIPTAMSGLFGALMVGLGRAVGETMIVLMAAGNTAIMDWNVFNGFRTLSANIATELPEAPKDETHYRVLFLAALVLFAMTFVINTMAEVVRRIFRRRFAEL
ncbi:MAG: ABC transporter permease subunit [Planctomycetota bacterium]|nr:ABC transporter permease subunit [Planctomycetota bacterium]